MKAALTKITQWVRSRDGSGILRSIWSGTWTSQKIWEVKYIKCYYLKALVTSAFSQKGWEGRGHLQGPQHRASCLLWWHCSCTSPLVGKSHTKGDWLPVAAPGLGLLALLLPELSLSLCQHVILQQQGINPVSSACSTTAPSCCCCCSWLYC